MCEPPQPLDEGRVCPCRVSPGLWGHREPLARRPPSPARDLPSPRDCQETKTTFEDTDSEAPSLHTALGVPVSTSMLRMCTPAPTAHRLHVSHTLGVFVHHPIRDVP